MLTQPQWVNLDNRCKTLYLRSLLIGGVITTRVNTQPLADYHDFLDCLTVPTVSGLHPLHLHLYPHPFTVHRLKPLHKYWSRQPRVFRCLTSLLLIYVVGTTVFRVGANSNPELELQVNSNSGNGIGIEIGGIENGIGIEIPGIGIGIGIENRNWILCNCYCSTY